MKDAMIALLLCLIMIGLLSFAATSAFFLGECLMARP